MIEGSFFGQNLDLWISIILTVLVLALGLVIYDIYNHRKLKARYEVFMGINKKRRNDVNMEKLLVECVAKAESIGKRRFPSFINSRSKIMAKQLFDLIF